MRKETAAKKKLCVLSLCFTGRYCFTGGLVEQIRSRRICDPAIFFLSFLRRNQSHPLFNVSQAAELVLLTHQELLKPTPNFFPVAATGSGDGGKAGGLGFVASLLSLCFARDFVVVLRLPGGACKPRGRHGAKSCCVSSPIPLWLGCSCL